MTTPQKTTNARKTISRHDFMKLCEWMRENRSTVEAEHQFVEVHRKVVAQSGIDVSLNAVKEAMTFLGLKLTEPQRKEPQKVSATKTLALEMVKMQRALKMEPSEGLLVLAGLMQEVF